MFFVILSTKHTKCFCNIIYKTQSFVDIVLNMFAIKQYKCFPPNCFFLFTVPTAIHWQNVNANFHKVVYRQYSGEVENVYITIWKIYIGQYTPNFIATSRVLWTIWQKHFGTFFGSQCTCTMWHNLVPSAQIHHVKLDSIRFPVCFNQLLNGHTRAYR